MSGDPGGADPIVVVGGGLVGLATARALRRALPGAPLLLLDKEPEVARHQSGRNSGILHSGLYYRPDSLKARFTREGRERLIAFAAERGIAHEVCGKVVVAVTPAELPRLAALQSRAAENGVEAHWLDGRALRAREPHARGEAALLVPATGLIDFPAVARALAAELAADGVDVRRGTALQGVEPSAGALRLATSTGPLAARFLVNCAGLFCDRVARLAGVVPPVRIIPFRGEYYRLRAGARGLVNHLIYPLPDPAVPFLGVHLHRTLGGEVWAGPNAVLATRREGYRRRDLSLRDGAEALLFPGFWRLARRLGGKGLAELVRATSRRRFLAEARRLVPALALADLEPAPAGVRAQAVDRAGGLVDDFLILAGERSLHVLNAPSPGATSCLPIGDHVAALAAAAL
ncbi:MAG TPA: L-2-hydroxyglutarate oxidase [Thermoanaerobaculia bacterium]|nr:L-2-hydroxyglutarate oxidase [Thermoanaerobaculia bacterium]